ncbi:MAG TPA: hypothetical protein VFX59_21560 [Polyangiales bacterium]|nr:hypothetical protein [Polyangiales bacterium]
MAGKRPCRVCGKWFQPHPRAGKRQRACGRDECGRERHRRACAAWHEQHPDYDRERRLRDRVRVEGAVGDALSRDPLAEIAWDAARDAVGLEAAVIVEETGKVLALWARDAVHQQAAEITRKLAKVLPRAARDEIAAGSGPP